MAEATPITGYRELSEEDIQLVNLAKAKANDIDSFICALENRDHTPPRPFGTLEATRGEVVPGSIDSRQLALARTHFEEGFMHLVRAITQPRSF